MARYLEERQRDVLEDLVRCPGLFAGQYEDLDLLPDEYVERRYKGAAGFMGLATAWPTDAALAAHDEAR